MTTKPTQIAEWATDATYTGGAEAGFNTKSEPTSPRKAEGFEPNTHPKSDEINWQLNLIGQWQKYVRPRVGRTHTIELVRDADLAQTEVGTGVATYGADLGPDGSLGWSLYTIANADAAAIGSQILWDGAIDAKHIRIIEWEVDSTALIGTPLCTLRHGFLKDINTTSVSDHVSFSKSGASANWFVNVRGDGVDGSGTPLNSGVAAGGVQRFAIVWYGATNSPSAAERIECYIDDALVLAYAQALTFDDPVKFGAAQLSAIVAPTALTCRVSPVKYQCCRYL